MRKFVVYFVLGALVLLILCAIVALQGWIVSVLWNFVAPVFWASAPHMNWMHGVAVAFLCNMLFGGARAASR